MENKKISIIIPIHNSQDTIERCVESIIKQEWENIECILIENNSTDNSLEICRRITKKNNKIKLFISEKTGVSEARNLGIQEATGDIIGFCDADDYMEPNALKTIMEAFEDSNISEIISGFYKETWSLKNNTTKQYYGHKKKCISAQEAMERILCDDYVMGSVWNKYYKADIIQNIQFLPELTHCEDTNFNIRVLAQNNIKKVLMLDIPTYCYVNNFNSITNDNTLLFDEHDNLKYIIAIKELLNEYQIEDKIKKMARMKIYCLAIDALNNNQISNTQRMILLREIRKNFGSFIKNIFKFNVKYNVKRLYWGIKFIINS